MKIKTKEVRDITKILDDIVEVYKEGHAKKKRDWRTYEQRVAERLKAAFRELKPLVHEAASSMQFVSGETRGAKPALNPEQRTLAVLIKLSHAFRLCNLFEKKMFLGNHLVEI